MRVEIVAAAAGTSRRRAPASASSASRLPGRSAAKWNASNRPGRRQHGAEHRLPRGSAPRARAAAWRPGCASSSPVPRVTSAHALACIVVARAERAGQQQRASPPPSRASEAVLAPGPARASATCGVPTAACRRCQSRYAPHPRVGRTRTCLRRPVEQLLRGPVGHADTLVVGIAGRDVTCTGTRADQLLDRVSYLADRHRRPALERQHLASPPPGRARGRARRRDLPRTRSCAAARRCPRW